MRLARLALALEGAAGDVFRAERFGDPARDRRPR